MTMPISTLGGWKVASGRWLQEDDIPERLRGTRVRWLLNPEDSKSGPCPECSEYGGQFMSIEQATALQPVHPGCVCGFRIEVAPGVG